MFTVKFMNQNVCTYFIDGRVSIDCDKTELTHTFLRCYRAIEVWESNSQFFKDAVQKCKNEIESDNEIDEENKKILSDLQDTYKAIMTFRNQDGEEGEYFIAETENVFVTDRFGNTVYAIK